MSSGLTCPLHGPKSWCECWQCGAEGVYGHDSNATIRPCPGKHRTARCPMDEGKHRHPRRKDLLDFADGRRFAAVLADPPWQFTNRTGKMAPEHRRLHRYKTLTLDEIMELPVAQIVAPTSHLYLWVPNALILEGLEVMRRWGFTYKTNLVWYKIRKDGGPDGRGVGFYFRNVTELVLFGVRGRNARTRAPGRRQVNIIGTRKREHSRKPDEIYPIVEACSEGPYLEMFARHSQPGWWQWGDEITTAPQLRLAVG